MRYYIAKLRGLKTHTSKKAHSKRPPQKPLAATSSLAPSFVMAQVPERASPVIGCKVGSMHTLWQTSLIRFAIKSIFIVSYSWETALWTQYACSTEKFVPHTYVVGVCKGCQPYLRVVAFLRAPSWGVWPNSSRGRDVSQLEAPFSCAYNYKSTARWKRVRDCCYQCGCRCLCIVTILLVGILLGFDLCFVAVKLVFMTV